ncbi:MAG TPA: hypothetical protein VFJ16_30920 [Longimicrobium sp.]|nr:hypothetical protein [Longimicrobium sp.]
MPRLAGVLAAAAVAGAASCPAAQPSAVAAPCAAVAAGSAPVRASGLAGEYRLSLVATRGSRAGTSVAGGLRLAAYAQPAQGPGNVRYPLYGSATLALDSVGAVAPGDIGSANPSRPGVRVIEWQRSDAASRTQLTLRFGADANGPETGQIEGTRLALFVDSVAPSGFYGRWESGTPDQRSGGHFCAERTAGR